MRPAVKRVLQGVAVAAAIGVVVLVMRPKPVAVDTGTVDRGKLRVTVDEEGETRVRDRFIVAAPVAGRLQRITLKAGDEVQRNAVVARMNPLPLDPRAHAEASARLEGAEAAKREADARVEQARAAQEQSRREAERAHKLEKGGTISTGERERADLDLLTRQKDLEAALFATSAADFNVQAARAALLASGGPAPDGGSAVLDLPAPVSGHVLRILEESERTVGFGTPLLELGDPDSLEIVVDLLTTDAVKVKPGALMLVDDWGGEDELEARVRLVEPSAFTKVSALGVEEQRVNVIADFAAPQPRLGDGYRLEAHVVVWEGDDVLKVPSSALFRHGGEWSVFVVDNGTARRRSVEIGHGNPIEREVLGGLEEGETVILHPSDLVADGVRVG